MKTLMRLLIVTLSLVVLEAQAAPAPVHTLTAYPVTGFSEAISVSGCAKDSTTGYGVTVYFYPDMTYQMDIDQNNDAIVDNQLFGTYASTSANSYYFFPDGEIALGTADGNSWGEIFGEVEGDAQTVCNDGTITVMAPTTNITAHSIKVSLNRATMSFAFDLSGVSGSTGLVKKGKVTQRITGTWN